MSSRLPAHELIKAASSPWTCRNVVQALDPIVGSPVQGIVGQDIMQAQHTIIDVQHERLYLKPLQGQQQTGC